MILHELLSVLQFDSRRKHKPEITAIGDTESNFFHTSICSIETDSRKIQPGSVFVALQGASAHGDQFIESALDAGAICIVTNHRLEKTPSRKALYVQVKDSHHALHRILNHFYDYPSFKMTIIAVTGTNGKTSSVYLINHFLNALGAPCGGMTTVEHWLGSKKWTTDVTTPDPITLQKRLSEMYSLGARTVAMEASSHGLHQKRLDGINISIGVFTNLTQDHLDYHKNINDYLSAKERLFTDLLWQSEARFKTAIVNTDDFYGRRLKIAQIAELITFGRSKSDVRFEIKKVSMEGTEIIVTAPTGHWEGMIPLIGVHNVYNVIGAALAVSSLGFPLAKVLDQVHSFTGIPGRLQRVPSEKHKYIFVDYAHTPDALENVLKSLWEIRKTTHSNSRIYCVFGCGGDRDKTKRPLMAQATGKWADRILLTSDNPRTEDPLSIIADAKKGFSMPDLNARVTIEVDRKKAIELAISESQLGDIVLIAGKGHEDYQIVGTEKFHFSDIEVAQNCLLPHRNTNLQNS